MELMVEVVVELQPYQQFHPEDPVRVQALHCKDMLEGVALLPETIGQVLVVEVVEVQERVLGSVDAGLADLLDDCDTVVGIDDFFTDFECCG